MVHAVGKLQAEQREVLILICASGLSYEEAAESLGCSIGTIKSRLWRARARMAALVLGEDAPTKDSSKDDSDKTPRSTKMTDTAEHVAWT